MTIPEINQDKIIEEMDDFVGKVQSLSPGTIERIYEAKIKSTGQKVLIKKPIRNDNVAINALIKEYNILMKSSHPSIPLVVGFYHPRDSQKYSLIIPFYEKGSLENLLYKSNEDIGNNRKLQIVLGILDALDYLHSNKIAHCNLRPNNILFDGDYFPSLVGFGISREYIERMPTAINTFDYFAPELYGSQTFDKNTDMYSFGLIVNEIYSRQKTFSGLSRDQISKRKLDGDVHADSNIPGFLSNLIERCLSVDPKNRPSCSEILTAVKNYINDDLDDNIALLTYVKELRNGRENKRCFNIPRQLILLPNSPEDWKEDMKDPIDWKEFNKIFMPTDQKVIIIMTIGNIQSGKSMFIRIITGNYGFEIGNGSRSTTMGILVDGPYKPSFLVDRIYDNDFRSKCKDLNIDDDILIYFIDTQGINDETYKKLAHILDKINSIFSSCSTFCISIPNINSTEGLTDVFKIMRRAQLIHSNPESTTSIMMLVKEYSHFTNLPDSNFDSLSSFQKEFENDYRSEKQDLMKYYFSQYTNIFPLGDAVKQPVKYIHSVWFIFYNLLSQAKRKELVSLNDIVRRINTLKELLFGPYFNSIKNSLFKENSIPTKQKVCELFTNVYANEIFEIVSSSQNEDSDVNKLYMQIQEKSNVLTSVYLPYFMGEFDITLSDFWQYTIEISKDSHSFNKSNSDFYKKHMKQESNATKFKSTIEISGAAASIPLMVASGCCFIGPVIICGIPLGYACYSFAQKKIRDYKMKKISPTIFPDIWKKNMSKLNKRDYDMNKIGQIGDKNDQLILFYEQNNNNSSLIFSSLIGYTINSNKEKISILFENVIVNSLMERYKRFGKVHQSRLESKKVHFLYLKGYSQSKIDEICSKQENKPILVSSLIHGQNPEIYPNNNICHSSYLFYLSTEHYKYYIIHKDIFRKSLNDSSADSVKKQLNLDSTQILFLSAPNYNFSAYGPLVQGQLKYGCRLVLQDNSLIENYDPTLVRNE